VLISAQSTLSPLLPEKHSKLANFIFLSVSDG